MDRNYLQNIHLKRHVFITYKISYNLVIEKLLKNSFQPNRITGALCKELYYLQMKGEKKNTNGGILKKVFIVDIYHITVSHKLLQSLFILQKIPTFQVQHPKINFRP